MIEIYGPSNSFIHFEDGDTRKPIKSPPFRCEAQTLQEALDQYCLEFGATVRPYVPKMLQPPFEEGRRLAITYDDPKSRFGEQLVVFSIERNGKFIHDDIGLDFALLPGDKIDFGIAGC
jgi:hypothetical protein